MCNKSFSHDSSSSSLSSSLDCSDAASHKTRDNLSSSFDPIAYLNAPRWRSSVYGLERIESLLEKLGNPHKRLRFVHVAGTNGKGCTCAFLARILQEASYTTGMFTSPFLFHFEERICVNGNPITITQLTRLTLQVKKAAESVERECGQHPTEFELMLAVAMLHFNDQNCHIVVLEVGLGGRLDATNVIPAPELCVIARIGLDHVELLGNDIQSIAKEKAGIIKPNTPVVKLMDEEGVIDIVRAAATKNKCLFHVVKPNVSDSVIVHDSKGKMVRTFLYEGMKYSTQMLACYVVENACLALAAVDVLRKQGWNLPNSAVYQGVLNTQWPGRFQVVWQKPVLVIDGAHNPQGVRVLVESLQDLFPEKKASLVFGVLKDKNYAEMIRTIYPIAQSFTTYTVPHTRALSGSQLMREIQEIQAQKLHVVPVHFAHTIKDAIEKAKGIAGEEGLVVIFGSLYSMAEIFRSIEC